MPRFVCSGASFHGSAGQMHIILRSKHSPAVGALYEGPANLQSFLELANASTKANPWTAGRGKATLKM